MKSYLAGGTIALIGIYLAVFLKNPHFYSFFSVGLFIIFLQIYKNIVHEKLFTRWNASEYATFGLGLLAASIIIDLVGLKLGYWAYPHYSSSADEVIKYIFEWCIALMYVTLSFFIGMAIFKKHGWSRISSAILSLVIFVIPIGLVTEYFNHMASSWVVLKTPFSNASVGGYFIVFQTIGYWTMALIPWIIYQAVMPKSTTR